MAGWIQFSTRSACGSWLIRSGLRNEPSFSLPRLLRMGRKLCFRSAVQRQAINRFCRCPRPKNRRFFRSCFDSSQARKTVRWRRFRGLEFAPEKGVKRAHGPPMNQAPGRGVNPQR